ncbi:diacylglycerol kinase family protein [Brumimicrobium mesophilum]|uniref:diacylglycerol kinase family protein n=1 Tax=Brumimicrobium mesophilum TaxID=392717 RepID=UPI000D140879|nr:diacylglycerol kinase family protein [Brumimicrobium mesophilum]
MFGFKHAIRGLFLMIKTERNFKIHVFALVCVLSLGFLLDITTQDWISILMVSALVISLEIINSAIEKICNLYSTDKNEKIKNIKDISAGAVLMAALVAFIVGVLVFYPYI